MRWLNEPVTKDFMQGLICGMGTVTVFIICLLLILK